MPQTPRPRMRPQISRVERRARPTRLWPRPRPAALLAVAVALSSALGLAGSVSPAHATTHASRGPGALSGPARRAGLSAAGGATMGWHDRAPVGRSAAAAAPSAVSTGSPDGGVDGLDVSKYQGTVDWAGYYGRGKRFAYVKATEGTYYRSSTFSAQYSGSYDAGFIRGSYHFANPKDSSGASQANYFVQHGGGWSKDGKTLPGALDIEYNPYSGGTCYGLSQSAMVSWIRSFTTTYRKLTGRDVLIYSTTDWWTRCTGNSAAFASTDPLWIARYAASPGTLPAGWRYQTLWQYTDKPVDQDSFNGGYPRLQALANG